MDCKATGIVVGVKDRGDFDKQLVLVTDCGRKNCIIKGVKRAASKLRFAGELFSLCEFNLAEGRGIPVVTNAFNLSMNYELRLDYDRFCAAGLAARMSESFCSEEDSEFLPFLLKSLEYIKLDERMGLLKFLLGLFERSGYALNLSRCAACGAQLGEKTWYSLPHSGIVCETCGGQRVREGVTELLRFAERGAFPPRGESPEEQALSLSYFTGAVRLLAYHLRACDGNADALEDYLRALVKNGGGD